MTEMNHRPAGAIGTARRTTSDGAVRCYVRFAVLGDRGGRRIPGGATRTWPHLLAAAVAASHDVSWCDVSEVGATAYDVRRAQLRVALAHRPHLVALDAGLGDLRRPDWDAAGLRAHLVHCAQRLTAQGAVLLTTRVGRGPGRHRDRAEQLDAVYDELARRFGTVHLDHGPRAAVADRFVEALAGRGLDLRR